MLCAFVRGAGGDPKLPCLEPRFRQHGFVGMDVLVDAKPRDPKVCASVRKLSATSPSAGQLTTTGIPNHLRDLELANELGLLTVCTDDHELLPIQGQSARAILVPRITARRREGRYSHKVVPECGGWIAVLGEGAQARSDEPRMAT